ncbi:MAG: class I SAM-dependent methyltransferase [Deltaproteobacteria bacterium]|nr:class I SAM-dependent methyltransferase [Deltaproteobacteria bacterium]
MSIEITDTAAAIARVRSWESQLPEDQRLFEDPYAHLFGGGAAADEAVQLLLSVPIFRDHVRLRTRFIDDAVRAALAAGTKQIVNLGVGFDCRTLRLAEIAQQGAQVFEVDLAEQLERKRSILAAADIPLPPYAHLVAADLATDFEDGLTHDLAAAGYERAAPAVIVWEGVLGYLDDVACDRTLRWIAGISAEGSRLVFNYPVSRFGPEELLPRIRAAGLVWLDDTSLADVYGRYLPGEPPDGGDLYRFAVAWR